MYYDYKEEINKEVRRQRAVANRCNKRKNIESDRAWRNESYGSASCANSSMNSIFAAYNEYKTCGCW